MGDSQEVRGFVFRQNGAPLPFNGNGFSLSYDYLSSAPDLGFQAFDGSGMANTSARHGPNIQSGTEPMISSGLNYAFNQFAPGRVSLRQRPSEANSGDSYSHLPDHRLTQPLPDSTTLGFKTLLDAYNQGQYNWPDTSDIAVSSFQQTPLFGQEDDTRSVISESTDCDSHCQLGDPCTGEACANEVDACTDKNCPEKNCPDTDCPAKLPSEVADAAATLAAIGGDLDCPPPRYPICQGVNIDTFGISESQNPFADELWPSSPWDPWKDIANHILGAHSDPSSSNCTRPCVIDDPHVFQHCHFYNALTPHVEHYSLTDTPFGGHGHGSANLPFQNDMKLEECGAEIPSPEALVEHFISEHRLTFEKALAQGNARADGSQPLFSERISSDSSTNAFESSIVPSLHSSPHDTFPPTPLSLSQETTEPSISSSHSRLNSASQLAAGTEWEQRCLWCCQEGGSPCGRIFNDSEALFDHVNTEHIQKLDKGPKGFLCCWENCKRLGDGKDGFPQRSKIERHMHTHIGLKPFQCETCRARFSAQQALLQHLLIHKDLKPLECDWPGCKKTFRQQSALTMHRRVHTGEKPLECPVCGKRFSESSNLSKHKRIHETKGRFPCPEPGCSRDFHRQDQLRRHLKLHEAKGETPERSPGEEDTNDELTGKRAPNETGRQPGRKKRRTVIS